MSIVGIVIGLIVFGVLFWLVQSVIPIPQPVRWIAICLVALLLVVWLLSYSGAVPMHWRTQ